MAGRVRPKRPSGAMTRLMAEMFQPLGDAQGATGRGVVVDGGNTVVNDDSGRVTDGGDAAITHSRGRAIDGEGA